MSFHNRIRLPFYINKPQFPIERDIFRKANGVRKVLSASVSNTYQGLTDYLPEDWHSKLAIALSHDEVQIENERYLTEVVLDSEYSIEWPDFKNYPVAQANFTIQVTPFDATNSNCQTCEQASQLSLEDDYFENTLQEDEVAVIDDVTENDSICCYPFTISLVSWNTSYLASAPTLTDEGELTVTVKASVVPATNILVATYMVTCEDGSYDEANVYADFDGSAEGCSPPSGLIVSDITDNSAVITWVAASPAPSNGYIWYLYDPANPVTPLQEHTTGSLTANITGLVPGFEYLVQVVSNCGDGDLSTPIQSTFTTTGTNSNCGSFSFWYADEIDPATISYMDCNGNIVNQPVVQSMTIEFCALINSGEEVPFYFETTALDPTLTYLGLCEE